MTLDNTNVNYFDIHKTANLINDTYDQLTYFDLYGNSVIIFIFMTLFVFIIFSYCNIMQTKETISEDWTNQRCKPQNILFAGFITHPEDTTAFQYTSDNFQYCVQSILTHITGYAVKPIQTILSGITQVFTEISESIQNIRNIIHRLRENLRTFAEDVLGRILNVMIPIQKMFIALMDTFQKIQGTMTAGLYTMLGSYYTLQSLMGAILELIVKLLVAMVVIIVGLWVMPFTWPAAATMSAVFMSISVPLSIIIYFMSEVLHVKASGIPQLRCFDECTVFTLTDGRRVFIRDICVGDTLLDGSCVTAKMKVISYGMDMYSLSGILVSGSHLIRHGADWIRISEHPDAKHVPYHKKYLYCLNTNTKRIYLGDYEFSDWDEVIDLSHKWTDKRFEDEGFEENDIVQSLQGGRRMKQVCIGDILWNGAVVYGLVEINAVKLRKYHLLTTNGTLTVNSVEVGDYNQILEHANNSV